MAFSGIWIPLAVGSGVAQTLRNASQRHLIEEAGTLGATLVRFMFGLPFAVVWLGVVLLVSGRALPGVSSGFAGWVVLTGVSHLTATALLLRVMAKRNFVVGVAYSRSELVQIAIFGAAFLGDGVTPASVVAIFMATTGVLLLSAPALADPSLVPSATGRRGGALRTLAGGWTSETALLGLACGGFNALVGIGYRGAVLELSPAPAALAGASTLVLVNALQVALLGGWLLYRNPGVIRALLRNWRPSLLAGSMGSVSPATSLTALAYASLTHVRTVSLVVELLCSLAVARSFFHQRLGGPESAGVALLGLSLVLITIAA